VEKKADGQCKAAKDMLFKLFFFFENDLSIATRSNPEWQHFFD